MARVRISTQVDGELLTRARAAHGGDTDASLIEAALTELLNRRRRADVPS